MIGRRAFLAGACTLATSPWVRAQPARKVFRIGILNFGDVPPAGAPPEPIVAALARLGYADGRNVEYVRRYARGQRERFQALVAEILAQEPDLVYSAGSDIARTFKTAGPRVPVVFVVSDDPVASGVVAAMNRPGGMFTGVSMMSPELSGKRLELLAAALPALARVAMLYEPDHLAAYPAEMKAATARMGIALVPLAFRVPGDFPGDIASGPTVGDPTNSSAIVDAIKTSSTEGVTGTITFDDHNDPIKSAFILNFDAEGNQVFVKQQAPQQ